MQPDQGLVLLLLMILKVLEDWERKWLLEFDTDKGKVLHLIELAIQIYFGKK